jgi:glucokinase
LNYAIGIDIGGTKTAIGIVAKDGQMINDSVILTDLTISPIQMIERMEQEILQLIEKASIKIEDILGIGVCAPGPLNAKKGVITCPPNLPNWIDVPIVEELEKRLSIPVKLENDANAATLSEKWIGAAQENDHFVYVTISTGIGAGLFLDGRLVTGSQGNAGEVGHIVIDNTKGTCPCGQKGCLEWLASGTAIARQGSEIIGKSLTTKEVFELYKQGHPQMVPFIEEVFSYIGIGCVTIINMFNPEKIVIGGGVSQVGKPLFSAVRAYIEKNALNPSSRNTPVVQSLLSGHVGVIGAAALIFLSNT